MMHIRGNTALSDLGKEKLLEKLRAYVPILTAVNAEYIHFIDSQRELSLVQCGQLVKLLNYGKAYEPMDSVDYEFLVIPHLDNASTWSFHSTQIAHDCGLTAINRIERGILYRFKATAYLNELDKQSLQAQLHDPYLELAVESLDEGLQIFSLSSLCPVSRRVEPSKQALQQRKLLSARWVIDEVPQEKSLFDLIHGTYEINHDGVINPYQNRKAVIVGSEAMRFFADPLSHQYSVYQEDIHIALQIANYHAEVTQKTLLAGAAIGQGAKPKAAFAGYAVADLQIPGFAQSWESKAPNSSALTTMLTAPLSNAKAHNQFGLPLLGGFFRTMAQTLPIIISGSYGNMRGEHAKEKPFSHENAYFVKLGWNKAPRCCQDLIDSCWALGEENPLLAVRFIDPGEAILMVSKNRFFLFEKLADRENCVYSLIEKLPEMKAETLTAIQVQSLTDDKEIMLWHREGIKLNEAISKVLRLPAVADKSFLITMSDRSVGGLVTRDQRVGHWQIPVADVAVTLNSFQGYKGGATAVGERLMLANVNELSSARMAIGEALTNIAAVPIEKLSNIKLSTSWIVPETQADSSLYALVKAITTEFCQDLGLAIVATQSTTMEKTDHGHVSPTLVVNAFSAIKDVRRTLTPRLSLNVGETYLVLIDLGLGKQRLGGSALAQVYQHSGGEAPDIAPKVLANYYAALQKLWQKELLLAYHDRSDGGLFVTLCEMAFVSHTGLEIHLDSLGDDAMAALFNEELGAVVQVRADDVDEVLTILKNHHLPAHIVGEHDKSDEIIISIDDKIIFAQPRVKLQRIWSELSYRMQVLQGHADCAKKEFDAILTASDPGLSASLTFDPDDNIAAPYIKRNIKPKVAILRRQGGTGHIEMAAAFYYAGFDCYDVHMNDLLAKRLFLKDFKGLAICSGFAYGDVLGAGAGWAKSILFNPFLHDLFNQFFHRSDTFTLGTGNGCQVLAHLKDLIPGANAWPTYVTNLSERFESRLCMVEVMPSLSIFTQGMAGTQIPVPVTHASGRAQFIFENSLNLLKNQSQDVLRYVDNYGKHTEQYPMNPNGSPFGITGMTSSDGRITGLIPHPEQVFRSVQMSWHPTEWGSYSPWMRMFRNARAWCE